ncbi:PHD and RING finger domain-containing protein 1-like isoform X2 [Engraulis encrasicolus]|uniref:PHD and RING finger domain-containing protein 1-like isoform X2 n=1 Tax=Engraulis encrasicolus TaxID=184585 RepID=UPI002FD00AB4
MSTSHPANCPVCLSDLAGQQVATPANCDHYFCLECIMQWSRNTNTCPVDRIAFDVLYQKESPGGEIKHVIKVENPRNSSEDVTEEQITCENCGRSDLSHLIILCSRCDTGYHPRCLTIPLDGVPVSGWLCPECADGPEGGEGAPEEDYGVSEEEVAALLAEAALAPLPSRLRLSTLTSPPELLGKRRSKRLCSQANKSSHDHRHTHSAQVQVPKYLLKSKSTVLSDTGDEGSSKDIQKSPTTNRRRADQQ